MRKLLTLFFGLALGCQAGQLFTIDFQSALLSGLPGSTVSFYADITNNDTSTDFINGDSITFPLPVDDSPLFNLVSLDPGQSSGFIHILDVMIPQNQTLGLYSGSLTIIGGADGGDFSAQDTLGAATFEVEVTPEPSTMFLLGGALLVFIRRRR